MLSHSSDSKTRSCDSNEWLKDNIVLRSAGLVMLFPYKTCQICVIH